MRIKWKTDVFRSKFFFSFGSAPCSRWTCRKFSFTTTVKISIKQNVCAPTSINKTIVFGLRLQRLLVRHSQKTKACARDTLHARLTTVRGERQTNNGCLQRSHWYAAVRSDLCFDAKKLIEFIPISAGNIFDFFANIISMIGLFSGESSPKRPPTDNSIPIGDQT